jgi:hypothetical protein
VIELSRDMSNAMSTARFTPDAELTAVIAVSQLTGSVVFAIERRRN